MSKHTPANQWRILFTVRPGVQIGSEKVFVGQFRSDESLANARLIAAAPALLEALQAAREVIAKDRLDFAEWNEIRELSHDDDPRNFVQIGDSLFDFCDAEVVASYDRALAKIDAAIAAATGAQAGEVSHG